MAPHGSSGLGNTKPGRCSASRAWTFTWNNPGSMAPQNLGNILGPLGDFGFGVEKAPTTGTTHYQGWIRFKTKCRPMEAAKLPKEVHWEKMKGTIEQNITYCSKEGNYITNFIQWKPTGTLNELLPWQTEIMGVKNDETQKNKIHVVAGKNCGKSAFARHLALTDESCTVINSTRREDIATCVINTKPEKISTVVIDIPRCDKVTLPWDIIENIHDGLVTWKGKRHLFNRPHIFILTPTWPEETTIISDKLNFIRP